MAISFTADEIRKVIVKKKTNKSLRCDEISVELTKYAPETIHEQIAEIYNTMTETDDTPREITHGILKPLHKPNKVKAPPSNLRTIILFSSLHKFSQHELSAESKIDSTQKYHHHKQSTNQIYQQLNISSLVN